MRNANCRTLNMSRKLTNEENEKIMVGPGKWRETWKNVQKRNTDCRTWKMARNRERCEMREVNTVVHGFW